MPSVSQHSHTGSTGTTTGNQTIDGILQKLDKYPQAQNIRLWLKENTQQMKSWSNFFDRSRCSKPANTGMAIQRINHNIMYYKTNYAIIAFAILLYSLLTNLWLLFSVGFLLYAFVWVSSQPPNSPIMLFGQSMSHRQMYVALSVSAIPLLWISSAGSTIFWVIGITGVVVVAHASMMEKSVESEFADA